MDPTAFVMPELRRNPPTRLEQTMEVLVFLLLIGPSMVLSLFTIQQGQVGFPLTATVVIFRDLGLVCLLFYFLWRGRESLSTIGWTGRHAVRELLLGVALFIPACISALVLAWAMLQIGLTGPATRHPAFLSYHGWGQGILAVVLVVVVAIAEETIFRGYLMLRLTSVFRSRIAAVLLSTAIFAAGHGYEGSAGLVTVGFLGLVFALVYLWRGSLIAPIVMHFLQDFLSIVLAPLLVPR